MSWMAAAGAEPAAKCLRHTHAFKNRSCKDVIIIWIVLINV